MRVADALNVQERSISGREAEIFLQEALGVSRDVLHAHTEQILTPEQAAFFAACVRRRERNEPVAYIVGHREFYGREFATDKRALIPRPETEALIDLAVQSLPADRPRILELGTGCGNIAVTLGLELAAAKPSIIATDISAEALALARENWQKLDGQSDLTFLQADLFDHPLLRQRAPFDLIVANLPYVPTSWQADPAAQPDVVFYEPDLALFGGADGLDHYRRFFAEAAQFLRSSGKIIIEFGEDETGDVSPLAKQAFPGATLQVHQDYAGLDRVLELSAF